MSDKFLTAKDVEREFFAGCWSYQKILRATRAGILPAVKFGKSYLYSRESLETWVSETFKKEMNNQGV